MAEELPPVAKIQYVCPKTSEKRLVGPEDYEIFIPRSSDKQGQHFFIAVNCLCGQTHNLVTEF
jgi:hypothetical protein